ncbi:MAG: triple tyrosine motif-containing protein [bacterium]
MGIDFSNLKKGYYTLTVRVTDNDNQNISAAVTRNLQIVE